MDFKCVLCGSVTECFKHPRFQMIFHQCQTCGLIMKDPSIFVDSKQEIKIYESHENSLEDKGYVNFLTNFIEQGVIPYISTGDALDYGSGPNPVLAHILKHEFGFTVDTYDYYFEPTKIFLNKTYDLITSTEVVEHVQSPKEVFKTLYNHLKPGGILSIMTLFYPQDRLAFFDWFYIRDRSHVVFYSPKTIEYIADSFGFELLFHNNHRVAVFKKKQ